MRLEPRQCRCLHCGTEWQGTLVLDCSIAVALRALRRLRCPECGGSRKLLLYEEREIQAAQKRVVPNPSTEVDI